MVSGAGAIFSTIKKQFLRLMERWELGVRRGIEVAQKHSEAGAWEVWIGAMGEAEHHVFRYPSLPAQNTSYEQKEGKMSSWEAMEKAQVGKSAMSH